MLDKSKYWQCCKCGRNKRKAKLHSGESDIPEGWGYVDYYHERHCVDLLCTECSMKVINERSLIEMNKSVTNEELIDFMKAVLERGKTITPFGMVSDKAINYFELIIERLGVVLLKEEEEEDERKE